jgi:hypothetical protein
MAASWSGVGVGAGEGKCGFKDWDMGMDMVGVVDADYMSCIPP